MKSEERILGDSDFVESALVGAREAMERKYRLKSLGCDLGTIVTRVSQLLDVPEVRIKSSGKEPERVKAKSVAAYWTVKDLGMAGTEVGKELSLTQSAVSRAVRRDEGLSENSAFPLLTMETHNFMGVPFFLPDPFSPLPGAQSPGKAGGFTLGQLCFLKPSPECKAEQTGTQKEQGAGFGDGGGGL